MLGENMLDKVTHGPRGKITARAGDGAIGPIQSIIIGQDATAKFARAAVRNSQSNQTKAIKLIISQRGQIVGNQSQIGARYSNYCECTPISAQRSGQRDRVPCLLNFAPPSRWVKRGT